MLGKVVMLARNAENVQVEFPHTVKFLDLGKQENVHLSLAGLTTSGDDDDSWCWHMHKYSKSVKTFRYTLD